MNKAPVYEVQPYEPKQPWEWHGIPVKIDLGDERGVCAGSIHPDMPDTPLEFPCYALFLDPAKALIIRGKDLEPARGKNGEPDPSKLIPKAIMTTEDINRNYAEPPKGDQWVWLKGDENSPDPEARKPREVLVPEEENRKLWNWRKEKMKNMVHQAVNEAVRIGLGDFVKSKVEDLEKERVRIAYDPKEHGDVQNLAQNTLQVAGRQSWGPVTGDDPKVWVKVV